jgi:hypothetical protein
MIPARTSQRRARAGIFAGMPLSAAAKRTHAAAAVLLAAALCVAQICSGQDVKPTEYQLKAAYLTQFGRFVEQWASRPQPSADESFDVCVLGQDPMGATLDAAVRGEKIGGASLAAKRIARPQDGAGCRVLFISASEEGQLPAILSTLGTAPVLTVSDMPDFVKAGGMIQFVLDNNHMRFEINLASARRSGLALSSELLKLARVVKRSL